MESSLKRKMAIAASAGADILFALVLVAGIVYWSHSRSKPNKPWKTDALVSTGAPSFLPAGTEYIQLHYRVFNKTGTDYAATSSDDIRVMFRNVNGELDGPMLFNAALLGMPIFIPVKQSGVVYLILTADCPEQEKDESDDDYQEKLRISLEESNFSTVKEIVLLDETRHYQITLPLWLSKPRSKK